MPYPIACACGVSFEVDASSAGNRIPCPSCREDVQVPRLSKLRESVNQGAFESSALATLNRRLAEGQMPEGTTCLVSGRPTSDWIEVDLACERPYTKTSGGSKLIWLLPVFGIMGAVAEVFTRDGVGKVVDQNRGNEINALVPLRVDREFHASLKRSGSQKKILTLMKSTPLTASLLDEYPMAKVEACRTFLGDSKPDPIDRDFS